MLVARRAIVAGWCLLLSLTSLTNSIQTTGRWVGGTKELCSEVGGGQRQELTQKEVSTCTYTLRTPPPP